MVTKGRLGRLGMLGGLAGSLAGELAGAATRVAVGAAREEASRLFHKEAAQKLLASLGRMKGLPMKAGQMLSYIDDFIPLEHRETYRETLRQLQVKARPMPTAELTRAIARELGKPPEELFQRFDPEPIAAASIGQVYRATLKSGAEVAVKVQYPGIREAIESDLKNLDVLRAALGVILPKVDVENSIHDLTSRILEECDYRSELRNQEQFRTLWECDPEVLVPRAFPELSGDTVLVSEFVEGKYWQRMMDETEAPERSRLGRTIARFVFRSLYVFAMFNADPHPGNYVFLADGRVAFLDFGCVQRYPEETLRAFRTVREAAKEGLRGAPFQKLLVEAYGLPADFDQEEWEFMEEFVRACFWPLLAPQPYRYDRAYTQRLADLSLRGARVGARKALQKGVWEAKRPGLLFLNRINFGLNSLLAALGAEADWYALVKQIDAEVDERAAPTSP
jgi:predicted unusual protein kinase regulating ubiquinone biosynthesis (AarF/ABC1/UbiB family)